MADAEQLSVLKQGSAAWNSWQQQAPTKAGVDGTGANLDGAELRDMDLRGVNLRGANLEGADLRNARLSMADLSETDLTGANLSGATVCGANLREANLRQAKLVEADLRGADLRSARLRWADLRGANLFRTDLSGEDLRNSTLSGADLRGANLRGANLIWAHLTEAKLAGANLSGADLRKADLRKSNLGGADLSEARLVETNLSGADLSEADLSEVSLFEANLSGACLRGANFRGAYFRKANLCDADLGGADFCGADFGQATVGYTAFVNIDLSTVLGLETLVHSGPSIISIDTIYKSKGRIAENFLRNAGVPESFVVQMQTLVGALEPIQFHACCISYSTKDETFAQRFHGELQKEGVRCWSSPRDNREGKILPEQTVDAIHIYDRLLVILSEHSMASEWVKTEITKARKRELLENRRVLFPVRLVKYEKLRDWECIDADTGRDFAREIREYLILEFSNWNDPDSYRNAFESFIKDLKTEMRPAAAGDASRL